jgi:hypothetical protein
MSWWGPLGKEPHLPDGGHYDLIDGQRPIREIIELSFVEEFETCKNLILSWMPG